MVEKIKLYLDEDALTELQDQYMDKETELRKELQAFIKNMFVNTKGAELNKTLVCGMEVEEDGKRVTKNEPVPFKDIDFTKFVVKFNPSWKPKEIDKPTYYELAVGDATYKKLVTEAQYFMIRVDKYNGSISKDKKKADVPTCFEECMYQNLYQPTMSLIMKKVGNVCDDEFEELNKLEDAPKEEAKQDAAALEAKKQR